VGGEAELQVGLDGVVALVLELVRLELLDQADAAAFLPDVEEDAALLAGDEGERGFHLLAALAAERVEDVAREAFGVDPDGDGLVLHYRLAVLVGADVAHAEGDVEIFVDLRLVEVDAERAEPRRKVGLDDLLDEPLLVAAVLDQLGDGRGLQPVFSGELEEVGQPRHRAVFLEDFDDDRRGLEAREADEVDGAFRVAGADEDAAAAGPERMDVAGAGEVAGPAPVVDRRQDGLRAVESRRAGRDAGRGVDRHGEVRAVLRGVVQGLEAESEAVALLLGQGEAELAAGVPDHEVDGFGGDPLGRHHEVALVLPVLVVHQDNHASRAELVENLRNRRKLAHQVADLSSSGSAESIPSQGIVDKDVASAEADVELGNDAAAAGMGEGDVEGGPGGVVVGNAAFDDDLTALAGDADIDEPPGGVLPEAPHDIAGDLLIDARLLGGGLRAARRAEQGDHDQQGPGPTHDWLPPGGACARWAPPPLLYP